MDGVDGTATNGAATAQEQTNGTGAQEGEGEDGVYL
jgi:hypothetical protein